MEYWQDPDYPQFEEERTAIQEKYRKMNKRITFGAYALAGVCALLGASSCRSANQAANDNPYLNAPGLTQLAEAATDAHRLKIIFDNMERTRQGLSFANLDTTSFLPTYERARQEHASAAQRLDELTRHPDVIASNEYDQTVVAPNKRNLLYQMIGAIGLTMLGSGLGQRLYSAIKFGKNGWADPMWFNNESFALWKAWGLTRQRK